MSTCNCSICLSTVDSENAEILTMGGYGYPRYLCEECAGDLTLATTSPDCKEIEEVMDRIGNKLWGMHVDDEVTIKTVSEIFESAMERAIEIKNGTYDFSKDEAEPEDVIEDIPEDMKETEEDRLLDEKEAQSLEKFNKILNWVTLGVAALAVAFIVFKFLS